MLLIQKIKIRLVFMQSGFFNYISLMIFTASCK